MPLQRYRGDADLGSRSSLAAFSTQKCCSARCWKAQLPPWSWGPFGSSITCFEQRSGFEPWAMNEIEFLKRSALTGSKHFCSDWQTVIKSLY